jgi:TonB family protein
MPADWKQWEGRGIKGGEFPLQRFLGGSDDHAVFLVEKSGGGQPQTAIRITDADAPGARDELQAWEAASKLRHPNVLRIFETGGCEIDGRDFLYAWTEYGEEDLAQILPGRPLRATEVRQILEAALPALSYLHGKGLVHGNLKPSNIFAVSDTVKISCDTVRPAGKPASPDKKTAYDAPEVQQEVGPAADMWSLGVTLAEALTQRPPASDAHAQGASALPGDIPQPFKEIIENCLQVDPAKRWTAAQIQARLQAGTDASPRITAPPLPDERKGPAPVPGAPAGQQSAKWIYVIAVGLAVIISVILFARRQPSRESSETQPSQTQSETPPPPPKPSANRPQQAGSESNTEPPSSAESVSPNRGSIDGMLTRDSREDVLQRVTPRVSPSARRTITGMIRVRLRLNVDGNGNVTEARLQSAGPSKYFARVAEEAAREWKFKPAVVNGQAVSSKWNLNFGFSRRSTEADAERTSP